MPEFKYRLQPLLDLKVERKAQLQLELAARQKELAAEQEALVEMTGNRTRMQDKLAASRKELLNRSGGSSGRIIEQHKNYMMGLTADLEAAKAAEFAQHSRVRKFEENVEKARQALAECSREVDVLNKHRSRVQKRFLEAAERQEAVEQDEMSNAIFNRRRGSQ